APLIRSQFSLQREEALIQYVLDRGRFEPIVNILVAKSTTYNGLPRFVIRQDRAGSDGEVLASAGLNWQSPQFAELYVHTKYPYRRRGLGRSVVAAAAQHVLESGRIPLYVVAAQNQASRQLAESVGFVDIGLRRFLAEGSRSR
ncbi:MAG: GNAT family N-acetyltransferase, partial [Candidatus Promineifilaceae bacterium]|nr:GNAT family N-acetyltransferase [Candidatus Promineifilaceae bacterium]